MTEHNEHQTFKVDEIPYQEISDPAVLSKTPLVSVKMITYNHEPYIAQAIEGVLMQETDFPIELIIGEDCSTDGTREIVFDYQRKYSEVIRVITSNQNVGVRKNGLRTSKACRGKYFAFCEGDDYWHHPKKLQMQVDYMESHSEYGLVHGDIDKIFVEKGNVVKNWNQGRNISDKLISNSNLYNDILLMDYWVYTCTVCARKELIDDVVNSNPYIFRTSTFLIGDLPIWLEMARRTKFKYIPESLSSYRVLPESATNSKDINKFYGIRESIFKLRLYYAERYNSDPIIINNLKKKYHLFLLQKAYRLNNSSLADEAVNKLKRLGYKISLAQKIQHMAAHHYLLKPVVFGIDAMRNIYRSLVFKNIER